MVDSGFLTVYEVNNLEERNLAFRTPAKHRNSLNGSNIKALYPNIFLVGHWYLEKWHTVVGV